MTERKEQIQTGLKFLVIPLHIVTDRDLIEQLEAVKAESMRAESGVSPDSAVSRYAAEMIRRGFESMKAQ